MGVVAEKIDRIMRDLNITIDTKHFDHSTKSLSRAIAAGVRNALSDVGHAILRDAKLMVPRDLGHLQRTGYARPHDGGYAVGFTEPTAVIVHEDQRAASGQITHGQPYNVKHADDIANRRTYWYKGQMRVYHTRRPQEAFKFLENPVNVNIDRYAAIAQRAISEALKG